MTYAHAIPRRILGDVPLTEAERLARVEKLANKLDGQWRLPLVGWRFGWDQLLGMVPVAGDALALALSLYLIATVLPLKPPKRLVALMVLNVGLDFLAGSVPIAGNIVDWMFPANQRNAALIRRWSKGLTHPA